MLLQGTDWFLTLLGYFPGFASPLSEPLLGSSNGYLTMAADLQVAMQVYAQVLNKELTIVRWLERSGADGYVAGDA